MIKTTSVLPDFPDFHEFYGYTPEKALFFDIETTGLSHKSACVFLIGTIHLENGSSAAHPVSCRACRRGKTAARDFFVRRSAV